MNLIWVIKIIFPIIFSLLPLGLYQIFRKQQLESKVSFLASFFFIFMFTFFTSMLGVVRQQIAELFFMLIILLIMDKKIEQTRRMLLLIIFSISIIISHYAISYIYVFSIVCVWFIFLIFKNSNQSKLLKKFFYDHLNKDIVNQDLSNVNCTISTNFVILLLTFTLTWYLYVS